MPLSFLFSVVTLLNLAPALVAQMGEPIPQEFLEKVAASTAPFETLDVTYQWESGPNAELLQRKVQARWQVDAGAGLYRQEQVLPYANAPHKLMHRVQVGDGKVSKVLDHGDAEPEVRLGMPLTRGQGSVEAGNPALEVVFTELYVGLAEGLRAAKSVRVERRSDTEVAITLGETVRLIVDPATGNLRAREDLATDANGGVYPRIYREIEGYIEAGGRAFPTRVTETYRDEAARVVKVARYTVEASSVRVNEPISAEVFTLDFPEDSRVTDSVLKSDYVVKATALEARNRVAPLD